MADPKASTAGSETAQQQAAVVDIQRSKVAEEAARNQMAIDREKLKLAIQSEKNRGVELQERLALQKARMEQGASQFQQQMSAQEQALQTRVSEAEKGRNLERELAMKAAEETAARDERLRQQRLEMFDMEREAAVEDRDYAEDLQRRQFEYMQEQVRNKTALEAAVGGLGESRERTMRVVGNALREVAQEEMDTVARYADFRTEMPEMLASDPVLDDVVTGRLESDEPDFLVAAIEAGAVAPGPNGLVFVGAPGNVQNVRRAALSDDGGGGQLGEQYTPGERRTWWGGRREGARRLDEGLAALEEAGVDISQYEDQEGRAYLSFMTDAAVASMVEAAPNPEAAEVIQTAWQMYRMDQMDELKQMMQDPSVAQYRRDIGSFLSALHDGIDAQVKDLRSRMADGKDERATIEAQAARARGIQLEISRGLAALEEVGVRGLGDSGVNLEETVKTLAAMAPDDFDLSDLSPEVIKMIPESEWERIQKVWSEVERREATIPELEEAMTEGSPYGE